MWSKPILYRFQQPGRVPQTQVLQGFAAFRLALFRIPPRHSQSRRATNCATPGYSVFYPAGRILPNLCLNLQAELCRTLWHFPALLRFLFETLLPCSFQTPLSSFGICVGWNSVYKKCFRPGLSPAAGAFYRSEQLRNCVA